MGLDIFIETGDQSEDERKSCHGISREFCYQVCELAHYDEDLKPYSELVQIYQVYQLDFNVLSEINVWRFEKDLRYGNADKKTKAEIDKLYTDALRPSSELLTNLKSLYTKIENEPELLNKVQWRKNGRKNYTDRFHENSGDYVVDKNLGWDLRTMIEFLEGLSSQEMVRFGFI